MNDTGQTGTTYTASQWYPTGFLGINSPSAPIDYGTFAGIRTPDNLYNVYFAQGLVLGGSGAFRIKAQDVANGANSCSFDLLTNGYGGTVQCGGSHGNDRFLSLQPMQFQVGSTSFPILDIAAAAGFMTSTNPMIRLKANSSAGACPNGGCGIFVSADSGFNGYLSLLDKNGIQAFGVKPTQIEFFGNSLHPITAVPGTGVNLLRSIGSLNNGNLAAFDANNNAVDSGVATSSLYSLGGTVNVDSCTLGSAAGSGTSCTAVGVDAAHIVTVTMGSGATTAGNLVTITLATNRPRPTLAVCSYSPSTGAAATDYSKSIIVGNAANQYTIAFPASAPTASVTYTWSVTCP